MVQSMGLQRVGHNLMTEQQQSLGKELFTPLGIIVNFMDEPI